MTEYRIDDLAQASGTTTRNIRGYQERGLLPQPLRRGRIAIYTEKHLWKLRAINKLLAKGFSMKHIAMFLTDPGARVGDALELTDLVDEPWARGSGAMFSRAELEQRLGPLSDEMVSRLVQSGIVLTTDQPDGYQAVDADIVENFGQLVERGMELATLIDTHAEFSRRLDDAVAVLLASAHEEIIRRKGAGWLPETEDEIAWATDLLATMRRTGTQNARAALHRALDTARRNELDAHQAAAEQNKGGRLVR